MPATTPILFPSGEDANPLHKRLPAEVVTRRRRPEAKVVEEKSIDEVKVDLKTAVGLKPDTRPKWLAKACKMAEEGRASTTELYNIITSRKFLGGLPSKIGRRLRDVVHENVGLFSDKQQRYLRSDDWALNAKYGEKADDVEDAAAKEDDDGDDAQPPPPRDDDDKSPPPPPEKASKDKKKSDRKESDKRDAERKEAERRRASLGTVVEQLPGDTWVSTPRGQDDRVMSRDSAVAEERARRKEKEREEQERWMEVEAEASRRRAAEQQEAKKRQLEDEADSSMMLLESMMGGGSALATQPEPTRESRRDDNRGRGRGGLSRSRSIRVRSRSRRRRKGSRDRRRRRSPSEERPRVDFAEALRRRMEERETNDTTRIPVVDPGHAARWAARAG